LGLAISGRLANLMGGEIELSSDNGLGSRFVVTIPLAAAEAPRLEMVIDSNIPVFSGCVLVVDDNASNRLIATRMLERLGFETVTAENGNEAVQAVAEKQFDAVLMDCLMPELDGFGATRAIRANENGVHRTPIIALTASAFDSDRRRCLDAGMDDFLAKPIRLEALANCLSRWVPTIKRVRGE
jgi:CheY-like chemotaxis protein